MTSKKISSRIWEVDCLRGLAVCMMLVSNFFFDLFYFFSIFDPKSPALAWFAKITAGMFLFLVGISLTLSSKSSPEKFLHKSFSRAGRIFALGLLISIATRVAVGDSFVVFGILHLIGLSIILSMPFIKHKWLCLIFGCLVLGANIVTGNIRVDYPWLLWLGIQNHDFASVDYTPIIPWFGLVLLGICTGNMIYPQYQSKWPAGSTANLPPFRFLSFCGRHSLMIYFIHQPIFWAGFYIYQHFF